jgi:hypothetical protein
MLQGIRNKEVNTLIFKKLAKELYRKMHPTTPIEQLEADIVERGREW